MGKTRALGYLFWIVLFGFSGWLMWHTLSYSPQRGAILVSGKYWSDFAAHLPLIRSFSLGQNWPPEYPAYPGEPIRYHFLFFWLVGMLERAGLRLDWALNIPSAVGFFLLLVMIWKLGLAVFKSRMAAALGMLFFLFNGSWSWIYFLTHHQLADLPSLSQFPAFAPWNDSIIAAFWNLNVYTNQRHLGLSYALLLFLLYILFLEKKRWIRATGFILGSFLVLNQPAFAIGALFSGWWFLRRPEIRKPLLISGLGLLPWIPLWRLMQTTPAIVWQVGFLTRPPVTVFSVFKFWLFNAGWHLLLIPLGFFWAPKAARIFIGPMVVLFAAPNLFRLSTDIINNHKFFNFFFILGGMFSAYAISRLWKTGVAGRMAAPVLVLLLITGGIVDFFPVKNDNYFEISDVGANPDAGYFLRHTPPDAVVLNSTWFFHPASLAGRKIFNGYSYFSWSFGYDQVTRERETVAIYSTENKSTACSLLKKFNISYVELNPRPESFLRPNFGMWNEDFTPVYTNAGSGLKIYSVRENCGA